MSGNRICRGNPGTSKVQLWDALQSSQGGERKITPYRLGTETLDTTIFSFASPLQYVSQVYPYTNRPILNIILWHLLNLRDSL